MTAEARRLQRLLRTVSRCGASRARRGSGTLRVDGEEVELRPGVFVYCSPEARRQMCAGAEGLVWIGIGATGADT